MTVLNEIVAQVNALEAAGESISDEMYYAKEIALKLLAGKVDQACELREAVNNRIEALSMALAHAKELLERVDACFEQALQQVEAKKLSGLGWSIRLQNNSKGSVVIEDENAIPLDFRRVEVSLSPKFAANDEESFCFWSSVILKTPVQSSAALTEAQRQELSSFLKVTPNKTLIESVLKKEPAAVPGARLHRGQHLRITKGADKGSTVASEVLA